MNFTTLSSNQIIDTTKSIINGRMSRISYRSEMPIKAEFKKRGISITKITDTTARFGIKYENIHTVAERRAEGTILPEKAHTNNYSWVIENKISYNSNTNKMYVRATSLPHGANSKYKYILVKDGTEIITDSLNDEMKNFVVNSYWNKSPSEVKNIQFENIVRIGKIGENLFC